MKLKLDDNGAAIIQNGHPVYVDDDGKDLTLDVPSMYAKIGTLNSESASRRQKINELTDKFAPVADVENLADFMTTAKEAIEKVKNLDDKSLLDADKVEELKAGITQAFEGKIADITKTFGDQVQEQKDIVVGKDAKIYDLMVSSQFATSPHFSGENPLTVLPPSIAESYFGKSFKVEEVNDKLVVVGYVDGNKIYSRQTPGEPATFNEAIETIVNAYPMKDQILRAGKSGSGSQGNQSGNSGSDIDKLKIKHAKLIKAGNIAAAIAVKNEIHSLAQQK